MAAKKVSKIFKKNTRLVSCVLLYFLGVSFVINRLVNRGKINIPVLCYHNISGDSDLNYSILLSIFEEHIAYISRRYKVISLEELVEAIKGERKVRPNSIAITFDDALESFFSKAWPILRKYDLEATLFVPTGLVGKEKSPCNFPHLEWREINKLKDDSIIFGAHSHTHRNFLNLSPAELETEIRVSKEELRRHVKNNVKFFAYPYGEFNGFSMDLLKKHGFLAAFSTEWGTYHSIEEIYHLPRLSIEPSDSLFRLRLKLNGAYNWLKLADRWHKRFMAMFTRSNRKDSKSLQLNS